MNHIRNVAAMLAMSMAIMPTMAPIPIGSDVMIKCGKGQTHGKPHRSKAERNKRKRARRMRGKR